MYYRIASQKNPTRIWQWKSTPLSSLNALLQFLRLYRTLPQAHLRVFSCPSHKCLDEMLEQENTGLESSSVTAEQFLRERLLCLPEVLQGTSERREHETQENQETSSIAIATISSFNDSNSQAYS